MGDGLRCPSLCSPVSDQCHDSQSTEHAPYYFDCQVCEHGNDGGAPCWPDYKYASPRRSTCHSDNPGDDGFYYIDCERWKPAEQTPASSRRQQQKRPRLVPYGDGTALYGVHLE